MDALSLRMRLFGPLELAPVGAESGPHPGPDEVLRDSVPLPSAPSSPAAQSLLAYLILQHDRPVARDKLTGVFWPERSDARARHALSTTLWQIRQALGPAADRLVAERGTVSFALAEGDWLDVEAFERRLENPGSGRVSGGAADPVSALETLSSCLEIYRGPFLEGCYDDWAVRERERYRELYLAALERMIRLKKRQGDYEGALAYAQRLASADPLRESAHREVMRLYHLLGRTRAALEQFNALHELLAEELGVTPSAATATLRHEIASSLEEDGSPHLPVPPPPPPLLRELGRLPFVGRERERTALLGALQAARCGHGPVALVEGDAGVGKTRLVEEVVADARWHGFQVAGAKADALVSPAPYQLFRDALSPLLTPLRVAQLAELVDPLPLAAASRVLPPIEKQLSELPALPPLSPDEERDRLRQGLIRCVRGLASVAPLLLVLEDVHWADRSTLDALADVASGISEGHVLTLITCRTAEARARDAAWEALEALERSLRMKRLHLRPFNESEVVTLVVRALATGEGDSQAAAFAQRLQEETGGNALFLVESLESLLEQGALGLFDGSWRFPPETVSLAPPASVRDMIARRLSRLSSDLSHVLEHVSVLGADASFPVLSRVVEDEPAALARRLGGLVERAFLRQGRAGYAFPHDLIRSVVYETIPPERRKGLHQRAGEAMEELLPGRVEALALHFELGEVWSKAVQWYRQAGERARAVYAGAQAIEYYDRALEAWSHLDARDEALGLQLYRERGRTYQDGGWVDQAEDDFRAALDLAKRTRDAASQARILNHLSYVAFQRGDFDEAARIAAQTLDMGQRAGAEGEVATAHLNRANALRNLGSYREAIETYERAAASLERLDDRRRLADCLNCMGGALLFVGDYARAEELIRRSLTIRRDLDDRIGISYSLINLAVAHSYRGHLDRARAATDEALEVVTDTGDTYGQVAMLHNLADFAVERGEVAKAITFEKRALTIAREVGFRSLVPHALINLGRCYQQLGDLERARELMEESLRAASDSVDQYIAPLLEVYLAVLYLELGGHKRALRHARSAHRHAETSSDPRAVGMAERVMGQVLAEAASQDAGSAALPHLERSIHILEEIGSEAELARSQAACGLILCRSSDVEQVQRGETLLEEARSAFRRLGMAYDLAQLESVAPDRRQPKQITVRLPHRSAPTGRPLSGDEVVEVVWTISTPEDEDVAARFESNQQKELARRRHRIRRLLREADEQDAAPTVRDLADALGVSTRTIRRDLAALRAEGHDVSTRGRRANAS